MINREIGSHLKEKILTFIKANQLVVMIGIATVVSILFVTSFFLSTKTQQVLFSHLSSKESSEIAEVLTRNAIPFKVQLENGAILVDKKDIKEARLTLSEEGLPRSDGRGYEIFKKSLGFASSQFMENARLKHALETELSRTISQFNTVKSARVHLAIPKRSAFLREEVNPSSSVFLDVYPNLTLSSSTIISIKKLVAGSVSGLKVKDVALVDQNGHLFTQESEKSVVISKHPIPAVKQTKMDKALASTTQSLSSKAKKIHPKLIVIAAVLCLLLFLLLLINAISRRRKYSNNTNPIAFNKLAQGSNSVMNEQEPLKAKIETIQELAQKNPKDVAEVVKNWVTSGETKDE